MGQTSLMCRATSQLVLERVCFCKVIDFGIAYLCRIKFETIVSETCDYLNGEKDFPIFSQVTAGYGCEQLLMTSTVPESRICTARPTCLGECNVHH